MTLLVAQTIQSRMTGWLMNIELERIWEKVSTAKFDVIPRNLPRGTEENYEKTSVGIAGIRADSLTGISRIGSRSANHLAATFLFEGLPLKEKRSRKENSVQRGTGKLMIFYGFEIKPRTTGWETKSSG
jgi:hypothetical protein